MVRVVLADDHPVVRQGLRRLLEGEPDLTVVGETGEGREVVALVARTEADVLVVDLRLPGLSGLEITRQVSRERPATRVLVLSMHATEAYVLEALANGASGYALKDSSADETLRAIREVAAGRRYLAPPLTDRAIEAYAQRLRDQPSTDPYDALTSREREVLQLAAEGLANAEIGKRLFISPRTVEVHRGNLSRKLGLGSQTDLVRYALRRGIVE